VTDPVFDTIICLSITEWSAMPQNSHHLMREASRRGYRVLFVDPIGLRRIRFRRKDISRLIGRLRHASRPFVNVEDLITRLAPLGVPFQDTTVGAAINRWLLATQIRLALRKLKPNRSLLWSYTPYFLDLSSELNCDLSVYYRVDDYCTSPYINTEYIERQEAAAVSVADLCIAANTESAETLQEAHASILVPNGLDMTVYGADEPTSDPISTVSHPRLLFAGTFDTWVDISLIHDLARAHQEWNVVLAGQSKLDLSSVTILPNVHYLGLLPYAQLPALMAHCDIGLVPYYVNRFTKSACIGKIYQYLAMGLPVASTPVLNESDYGNHVTCSPSTNADAYGSTIRELLRTDSQEKKLMRRKYGLEQTWSARFDAIEAEIRRLLAEKRTRSN
jgi:glycosyltransferase involved in cell wall biosynthesis